MSSITLPRVRLSARSLQGFIRIFMGTEAVPVEAARAEAAGATINT